MRFWTADMHFGHRNIIEYCNRPFNSVDHMNAILIANWNNTVLPEDEVHVVGDAVMGMIAETLPLLGQLNGRIVLHTGNHDRVWDGNGPKHERWIDTYLDAGVDEIIQGTTTVEIGGHLVDVNHFPYSGDSHDEDRYTAHRPIDNGRILIHGHVHDAWRTQGRQINVGCDVWEYTPVPDTALIQLIEGT